MSGDQKDPNIGQLLINRYRLVGMAGQGSMGRVYVAEDELLGGVSVAVKFLAQTLLNDRMKERFASEAQTGAQLGQKKSSYCSCLRLWRSCQLCPFLCHGIYGRE